MNYKPQWSPVHPVPTLLDAEALAALRKCSTLDALSALHEERDRAIRRAVDDPLRHGYEPPVWGLCDALLGVPWVDQEAAEATRKRLGFKQPVRMLLILGGNRSSKTTYMCRTGSRLIHHKSQARVWDFHSTHQQSVEYHHAEFWRFLPPELRRKKKGLTENISWNQKQGFSFDKFVLANASEVSFRNYSQDRTNAIEGGEPDAVLADELIPGDWIETLELRIATRNGFMVVGFTPIDGYTPAVKLFLDGSTCVLDEPAYLLPKDGGPMLEHAALGLTEEEWRLYQEGLENPRAPWAPPCRPREFGELRIADCGLRIEGKREFERAPRVLKCVNEQRAVVHFYSCDNPFGNAPEVIAKLRQKSTEDKRTRFYGMAERTLQARFPMFNKAVHVVPADKVPKHGTNYLIVDPCSGRSFFMLWIRATPEGAFVFKEWPGNYYIPGIGVPEPWAEPSGDAKRLDGKPGRGQRSPNWGLIGYKKELARVEGWREFEEWTANPGAPEYQGLSENEVVASWDQYGEARIKVHERFMDARFGNTAGFDEGGMVTLLEKFDEIGLTFTDTSTGGGRWTVEDGCMLIESALAYDAAKPIDFFNKPKLFVSEECRNLIFALEIYTGADGEKGAVKDPLDCLRYFYLKGCEYVETAGPSVGARGRGCY